MTQGNTPDLQEYYQHVQTMGKLRTLPHARRWSTAVLQTLGLNLDGRTKQQLAKALPEELGEALTRVFWLLHFRNTNLSSHDFQAQVARRSGNTDPFFARYPILAVFRGVKSMIDPELSKKVANTLSPEVRELWEKA